MFSAVLAPTTFDASVATESALQEGPVTAPLTTHAAPAPVIEYVVLEPEVGNIAPAPVCDCVAPAPEVERIAPVLVAKATREPVIKYVTPAPLIECSAPALAVNPQSCRSAVEASAPHVLEFSPLSTYR